MKKRIEDYETQAEYLVDQPTYKVILAAIGIISAIVIFWVVDKVKELVGLIKVL